MWIASSNRRGSRGIRGRDVDEVEMMHRGVLAEHARLEVREAPHVRVAERPEGRVQVEEQVGVARRIRAPFRGRPATRRTSSAAGRHRPPRFAEWFPDRRGCVGKAIGKRGSSRFGSRSSRSGGQATVNAGFGGSAPDSVALRSMKSARLAMAEYRIRPRRTRPSVRLGLGTGVVREIGRPELIGSFVVHDQVGLHRRQFLSDDRLKAARREALSPGIDHLDGDVEAAGCGPPGQPQSGELGVRIRLGVRADGGRRTDKRDPDRARRLGDCNLRAAPAEPRWYATPTGTTPPAGTGTLETRSRPSHRRRTNPRSGRSRPGCGTRPGTGRRPPLSGSTRSWQATLRRGTSGRAPPTLDRAAAPVVQATAR